MNYVHLKPPEVCDVCGSKKIKLIPRDEKDPLYKKHQFFYQCNSCGASVNCHKNTKSPCGKLADKYTKKLRLHAHEALDKIWKNCYLSREECYEWLAESLKIKKEECHISNFNQQQLKEVIEISKKYLEILIRRKAKEKLKLKKNLEIEKRLEEYEYRKAKKLRSKRRLEQARRPNKRG